MKRTHLGAGVGVLAATALLVVPLATSASAAKPTPPPTPPPTLSITKASNVTTTDWRVTSNCPPGEVVVGGGGWAFDTTSGVFIPIGSSQPIAGGGGWQIVAVTPTVLPATHEVGAQALCVTGTFG